MQSARHFVKDECFTVSAIRLRELVDNLKGKSRDPVVLEYSHSFASQRGASTTLNLADLKTELSFFLFFSDQENVPLVILDILCLNGPL